MMMWLLLLLCVKHRPLLSCSWHVQACLRDHPSGWYMNI